MSVTHSRTRTRTHICPLSLSVSLPVYQCPFRVVDEINQGMDATNEKRVFKQVVFSSTEEASQYFLVTPKLLPNLEYNEHMRVLCVYNGPFMVSHKEWDLARFLDTRARISASR